MEPPFKKQKLTETDPNIIEIYRKLPKDITVKCVDGTTSVNSSILRLRSGIFATMFDSFKEGQTKILDLPEKTEVVSTLFEYLQYGFKNADHSLSTLIEIAVAADKYNVTELLEFIILHLQKHVISIDAFIIYQSCKIPALEKLREYAFNFISLVIKKTAVIITMPDNRVRIIRCCDKGHAIYVYGQKFITNCPKTNNLLLLPAALKSPSPCDDNVPCFTAKVVSCEDVAKHCKILDEGVQYGKVPFNLEGVTDETYVEIMQSLI